MEGTEMEKVMWNGVEQRRGGNKSGGGYILTPSCIEKKMLKN